MGTRPLPASAALMLLAACAAPPATEPAVEVNLAPSPINAGSVGRATLLPAGDATQIELLFTGAGPQPSLPLHVYTYLYEGRCAQLPASPAHALNDRVLVRTPRGGTAQSRRGTFLLSHQVAMPMSQLAGGRYALVLRSAPADGGELLYCGDLGKA